MTKIVALLVIFPVALAWWDLKPVMDPPYSGDDECVQHNYQQFILKGLLSYQKVESSRTLGILRGYDAHNGEIPGVYHMDKNFTLDNQMTIYNAFKNWIQMERSARVPDLGVYSMGPKQLCFLTRELADWERAPYNSKRTNGPRPKIFCQRINDSHGLMGMHLLGGGIQGIRIFYGKSTETKKFRRIWRIKPSIENIPLTLIMIGIPTKYKTGG